MPYNISFAGEVKKGFDLELIKNKLVESFEVLESDIPHLFSGKHFTFLTGISQTEALNHLLELDNIGAILYIDAVVKEDSLPPGVLEDRRSHERRIKTIRRRAVRAGMRPDRRMQGDRRKN